jgi:hypothetical protein
MLDETQYGETREDGTVREPEGSVISGRPIKPGDVRVSFGDSRYFVMVKAFEWRKMTEPEQAAMRAFWRDLLPAGAPVPPKVEKTYEDMTERELRQLGQDRGVKLSSRMGKDDLVNALRVADVTSRFGASADPAVAAAFPPPAPDAPEVPKEGI